jgi:hypothetical protein
MKHLLLTTIAAWCWWGVVSRQFTKLPKKETLKPLNCI